MALVSQHQQQQQGGMQGMMPQPTPNMSNMGGIINPQLDSMQRPQQQMTYGQPKPTGQFNITGMQQTMPANQMNMVCFIRKYPVLLSMDHSLNRYVYIFLWSFTTIACKLV